MTHLDLFCGGGGASWTGKLLGWRTVGYIDDNEKAIEIVKARIKDGCFNDAPVFPCSIQRFVADGYAEAYRGVDVVTAGFPCRPFSAAGKRLGESDERNAWPELAQCLRVVRPRYALLENVPRLLCLPYFGRILGDLAEIDMDARGCVLSAANCGAPHLRKRLWILAYARGVAPHAQLEDAGQSEPCGRRHVSNAVQQKPIQRSRRRKQLAKSGTTAGIAADADEARRQDVHGERPASQSPGRIEPWSNSWWDVEPGMGRVAARVADRINRLSVLGNGWVPACAATAWRLLTKMA